MILQLIADTVVTGALTFGGTVLFNKIKARQVKSDIILPIKLPPGVHKYGGQWIHFSAEKNKLPQRVILCPKCTTSRRNKGQPPYCSCAEYHDGHFHFKCKSCFYEAIMLTDDGNK